MTTAAQQRAYHQKRLAFWNKMKAKGLVHWRGNEWITKAEFEVRYQAALAAGSQTDEDYRNRLLAIYGKIPDWAPARILRS